MTQNRGCVRFRVASQVKWHASGRKSQMCRICTAIDIINTIDGLYPSFNSESREMLALMEVNHHAYRVLEGGDMLDMVEAVTKLHCLVGETGLSALMKAMTAVGA